MTRFGRVTASRHAILDEDKEEVEAELVEASARPVVVGDDGKRGGRRARVSASAVAGERERGRERELG